MKSIVFVAAAIVVFGGNSAYAQGGGTPEDRAACTASVKRYCTGAMQGGDLAVLSCLQQNRSRIAPVCQQVLVKYGQ